MTSISKRLKEALDMRGMKQTDLVKLTGIGKSSISTYLSGDYEPKQRNIYKLAKALNVSEAWLMGYDVPKDRNIIDIGTIIDTHAEAFMKEMPSKMSDTVLDTLPNNSSVFVHEIPILGTISAGLPLYAEQNIEGYTYTDRNSGAEYFALRVKGDSMNAINICDGGIITVRRQSEVENGEIAVVMVNNDNATVKRFKRDDTMIQLIPQSYNPEHQIQIYDLKKDKINIIGKVVECKIEF